MLAVFLVTLAVLTNERAIVANTADILVNQGAVAPVSLDPADPELFPGREAVRFGHVQVGEVRYSVALFGELPTIQVSVDIDQDGEFHDENLIELSEESVGRWTGTALTPAGLPLKFMVPAERPDALYFYTGHERRGVLPLPDGAMVFAIVGSHGRFDGANDAVILDLDRDGSLDTEDVRSYERFSVGESIVLVDGRNYRVFIESSGDRLTLTPTDELAPVRPLITIGSPAPDVDFVDLEQNAHSISDFRGSVVVLHSWGSWCGPCKPLVPVLVEAFREFSGAGVRFVGVNLEDSLEQATTYAESSNMVWPHTQQAGTSDLVRWYKLQALPSYVVIDREGRVAAASQLNAQLKEDISAVLRLEESSGAKAFQSKENSSSAANTRTGS